MQEASSRIALFNEQGTVIGDKPRADIDKRTDILGGIYVLLLNGANHVYLTQQRDSLWAGKWGVSCGGLLRVGEKPAEAAHRTAIRELGSDPFIFSGQNVGYHSFDGVRRYVHAFCGAPILPITPAEDVLEGRWFLLDELRDLAAQDALMPTTRVVLGAFKFI